MPISGETGGQKYIRIKLFEKVSKLDCAHRV